MRIPVLFLLIPIIVHGYRLNEPRVLLPFDSKNLVSYLLEVKEPTGGCFFWKSSRPHIVSVEPVNQNRNCADSAIITARSRHLTDQSAVILATDHAGEISLNCDVRVDVIDRIEIFSTANFLFLEGPPAKIEIHGFNARGNQFSTLGSIPFDWQLKSLESNRRPLRIVSFSDSHYQVPFGIAELEAQKKRGAEILLEGIQTGKTKLTATLSELTTSTELFVVQKAILIPSEDLWVPIGAKINYSVVILKQSGSESVVLPSEQYKLKVSDSSICTWNDAKSQLEAKKIGHVDLTLIDTTFAEISADVFETVRVNVVEVDAIFFVVDKNENWHFQLNQDYKIEVRIRDVNGNELTIPENAKFKTQFTTSDHLRILDSAQNGTFFHVRPLKTGTTGIESEFVELVGEDGQSQKFASKITATQKIEINPPVKVEPTVLIFPPDSQYEWRLKASGGSGIFSFFSEQKHIAKIAEDGLIRTSGQLGRTIIHVEDYRNALNFDLATVLVLTPVQIDFSESRREAEIGSELTLNLRLLARDEETNAPLPYSDCRGADLRFAVENPKIFEIDFKKEPQIPTNGCRTVTLRAMASGDTKLIVWFGTLTTQFEISAYAPLRVISAAPLLSLGSEYAVEFTGGPRPWLLEPNGFFSRLESTNETSLEVLQNSVVRCKDKVADVIVRIHVGNKKTSSNPQPASSDADVAICCALPKRLTLNLKQRAQNANCPANSLSVHCQQPVDLELRTFGVCASMHDHEREFDAFEALRFDFAATPKELGNVKRDDASTRFEPNGRTGKLKLSAQAAGFHYKKLRKLPSPLSTELSVQLVDAATIWPSSSLVLLNEPSARSKIELRGGSGHFRVDSSQFLSYLNVQMRSSTENSTLIEVRPLKRVVDEFHVPIHDLCIPNAQTELSVKLTTIGSIRLIGDVEMIETSRLRVYDVDGNEFPADGLKFSVQLPASLFHVDRIEMSELADDSTKLNVKLTEETIFSTVHKPPTLAQIDTAVCEVKTNFLGEFFDRNLAVVMSLLCICLSISTISGICWFCLKLKSNLAISNKTSVGYAYETKDGSYTILRDE